MTRKRDMMTGQIVRGPRLGIESKIGGVVATIGHVPRTQALELGATRGQRLLIHRVRCLAKAHSEHVRVDRLVLVHARHELVASKIARGRASDRTSADAAQRHAVALTEFCWREEFYERVDAFLATCFQMFTTS